MEIERKVPKVPEDDECGVTIAKKYVRDNLEKADALLALHLGPKHPIRLELRAIISRNV